MARILTSEPGGGPKAPSTPETSSQTLGPRDSFHAIPFTDGETLVHAVPFTEGETLEAIVAWLDCEGVSFSGSLFPAISIGDCLTNSQQENYLPELINNK